VAVDSQGHPFVAWSDASPASPAVYVRGNTFDVGTVYHVAAAGSAANDGLSPSTPKGSIRDGLNSHGLHARDVVLVGAGSYAGGFTITATDAGVTILGAAEQGVTIQGAVVLQQTGGAMLQNLTLSGGITVQGGLGVTLAGNTIGGAGLTLDGGA